MKKIQNHRIRVAAEKRVTMENKLLMSGLILASEKSLHEISIEEIIIQAEVSRGSFYKYFTTAPDLFNKLAKKIALELLDVFKEITPEKTDPAVTLSISTRIALRLFVTYPLLGRLLLQIQWHSESDSGLFKKIESDIENGVKQKRFNQIPIKLGSSIVVGAMIGAISEMLKQIPAKGYEDKVAYHLLLSLGIDNKEAKELSNVPIKIKPIIPTDGILGKIFEFCN